MRLAFLAHRLGLIGTQEQLGYAVAQQFIAIRAQQHIFVVQGVPQPFIFNGEDNFNFRPVIFLAEDRDEIR